MVIVEVTVVTLVKHRLAEKDRIGESARICCVWVENRRASTVALLRLLRTAGVLAFGRLAVTRVVGAVGVRYLLRCLLGVIELHGLLFQRR